MQENNAQETKLTREQVLYFRKRLVSVIASAERKLTRLQELAARPSFLKNPTEKLQRHFRRVANTQKELEEAKHLANQIDTELAK